MVIFLILSQNIIYNADTIKYYPKKDELYLISNAIVIYGDLEVHSDTIIYNLKEKKLTAFSSPILYEKEREIKAKKMEYYIDEKKGVIEDGKTKVEKGYFYGKKIVYLKNNVIKIKNGYFTTCELEEPHYFFYSPKIKVLIDDRIIARNVFLFIYEIPVFYLPFFMYSITKERRSGFLVPKIGFSSYGGNFIQNIGWYQTLSRYADATIWFDYYVSTGVWNHIEFRYLFKKNSGNLKIDYAKERKGNVRWVVNGFGRNELPYNINLSYFSDYKSDNKIDVDYNQGETHLYEEANAELNLSKSFNFGNISTRIKDRKDFINNITTKELPRIDANLYGFKIFKINPNVSTYILRGTDGIIYSSSHTGFNFYKTLFPLRLNFGISLTHLYSSKTIDSTYYSDIKRSYNVGLKTSVYLISNFGLFWITRFRTVIDPYANFSFSEGTKPGNLYPNAPFSISSFSSKSFNYGLNITNQWKIKEKVYSPLLLNISAFYDFDKKIFADPTYNFSLLFTPFFRSGISGYYEIKSKKIIIKSIINTFNLQTLFESKPLTFNLSHSLTKTDTIIIQSASVNLKLFLTKNFDFSLNTNYSFSEKKFNTTRINLNRNLHCWYFEFSYSQYLNSWNYHFRLGIKDIPELKLERNTIKWLFP